MAMLAEPRRKTKYKLQPFSGFSKINKRCDDDTSSFGFKMMANMGWSPGKGLGLNETGNIDPIKLRLKNDDAGLGYKVSEDDAVAQQSEFQALLLQLNGAGKDTQPDEPKKKSKKPKIKSLEKQSQQSTVRVHYKKFTRGKDLSRASEKDLRSILGLALDKPKHKTKKLEVEEPELKVPEPVEDVATVGSTSDMYVTAGSSVDYFKKRFQEKKKEKNEFVKDELSSTSAEDTGIDSDRNQRRSVTWGDVSVSYVDKYIKDMVDTSGSGSESLNIDDSFEEPPKKKRKKKKSRQPVEISENAVEESETVPLTVEKKKKKKKRKLSDEQNCKENIDDVEENSPVIKKKKKRKLDTADQLELTSEVKPIVKTGDIEADSGENVENLNVVEEPKQKRKKKKNKKNQVSALPE